MSANETFRAKAMLSSSPVRFPRQMSRCGWSVNDPIADIHEGCSLVPKWAYYPCALRLKRSQERRMFWKKQSYPIASTQEMTQAPMAEGQSHIDKACYSKPQARRSEASCD